MSKVRKVTVPRVAAMKDEGRRIAMVTAHDAPTGRLVDEAGADIVLVGDSLAMTVLGYDSTLPVTVDEMLHHTRAVRRGVQRALVVGDMPFGSVREHVHETIDNAVRFLKEAGADAVKIEGGVRVASSVRPMVEMGIPVMGHIGMTPQSMLQYGGFKVQGRDATSREAVLADARALEDAGAFALVLECIPEDLGTEITAAVRIPTIGIGAGRGCDGQVLVLNDILGLEQDFQPKFVKRYADLASVVKQAVGQFCDEVRTGVYPGEEHRYK